MSENEMRQLMGELNSFMKPSFPEIYPRGGNSHVYTLGDGLAARIYDFAERAIWDFYVLSLLNAQNESGYFQWIGESGIMQPVEIPVPKVFGQELRHEGNLLGFLVQFIPNIPWELMSGEEKTIAQQQYGYYTYILHCYGWVTHNAEFISGNVIWSRERGSIFFVDLGDWAPPRGCEPWYQG